MTTRIQSLKQILNSPDNCTAATTYPSSFK